jgi:mannose-6-phosphate isomerase-like protein (cupin superfamily)
MHAMTSDEIAANWPQHVAPSQACSPTQMQARIARFADLPASPRAFVDTHLPGHTRTLMSVIGQGVTDNPAFKPKIAAAENFHVDFITAPIGCGAALHWHDSEEVFIIQAGAWEVDWVDGATQTTHTITLQPRDTISVPPFVHRAFRSLDGAGLMISVLGGKTPGAVKWHESVAARATAIGVGLDARGVAHQVAPRS